MEKIKFINLPNVEASSHREVFSALQFQPHQTFYLPFTMVCEPASTYNAAPNAHNATPNTYTTAPNPYHTAPQAPGIQTYNPQPELPFPENPPEPTTYIPMPLAQKLHALCNGHQFEPLSEDAFYNALNLRRRPNPLVLRPKEKLRVCLLLHHIARTLNKYQRTEWENQILPILGIKHGTYKSKSTLESIGATTANATFQNQLQAIFS